MSSEDASKDSDRCRDSGESTGGNGLESKLSDSADASGKFYIITYVETVMSKQGNIARFYLYDDDGYNKVIEEPFEHIVASYPLKKDRDANNPEESQDRPATVSELERKKNSPGLKTLFEALTTEEKFKSLGSYRRVPYGNKDSNNKHIVSSREIIWFVGDPKKRKQLPKYFYVDKGIPGEANDPRDSIRRIQEIKAKFPFSEVQLRKDGAGNDCNPWIDWTTLKEADTNKLLGLPAEIYDLEVGCYPNENYATVQMFGLDVNDYNLLNGFIDMIDPKGDKKAKFIEKTKPISYEVMFTPLGDEYLNRLQTRKRKPRSGIIDALLRIAEKLLGIKKKHPAPQKMIVEGELPLEEKLQAMRDIYADSIDVAGHWTLIKKEHINSRASLMSAYINLYRREKKEYVSGIGYCTLKKDKSTGIFKEDYFYLTVMPKICGKSFKLPETIEFDTPEGKKSAKVICFEDDKEMVEEFTRIKRENNCFMASGHNFFTYDRMKLRELYGDSFQEGMDDSVPRHVAKAGFYHKVIAKGFHSIDGATDSQHYNPGTINNKLDTVFTHFKDVIEKKKHSYEEQTKLRMEQELGNMDSAISMGKYCLTDVYKSMQIFREIRKHNLMAAKAFKLPPETICTNSRDGIAIKYFDRDFFERMNTYYYEDYLDREVYDDLDIEHEKLDLLRGLCELKQCKHIVENRRGIYDDAHVLFLAPFTRGFNDIISANKDAHAMRQEIHSQSPKSKIRYMLSLDAYCKRPYFMLKKDVRWMGLVLELAKMRDDVDIGDASKEQKQKLLEERISNINTNFGIVINSGDEIPWIKDSMYGMKFNIDFKEGEEFDVPINSNIKTVNNSLVKSYGLILKSLKEHCEHGARSINHSKYFSVYSCNDAMAEELRLNGVGVSMGKARVLSNTRGDFVFCMGNNIYVQSNDITGKKGNRPLILQDFMPEFFDRLLVKDDRRGALEYAVDFIKKVRNNEFGRCHMMVVKEHIARSYMNYSDAAARREFIKQAIENKKMKGERLAYGYGIEKGQRKTIAGSRFLEDDIQVDTDMYMDKLFGLKIDEDDRRNRSLFSSKELPSFSSGIISDYLESAYASCDDKSEMLARKRALSRVIRSEHEETDLELLCSKPRPMIKNSGKEAITDAEMKDGAN